MKIVPILMLSFVLTFIAPRAFNTTDSQSSLDTFIKSGSMMGYFTAKEFTDWFEKLKADPQNNPFLTNLTPFGKSLEEQNMMMYFLTDDAAKIDQARKTKNVIMVTGLHHAREPLTLTMAMHITIQVLRELRSPTHNAMKALLRDNILAFLPMINIDSYKFITDNFAKGKTSQRTMMIRKNRRIDPSCNEYSGGVDLNRNYEFMFALNEAGSSSNPCAEDYRGKFAFSEPETQSVRDFVNDNPTIVTGINLHSYGNAWIYPYNYVADGRNELLTTQKPLFEGFYEDFVNQMKKHNYKAVFGNAAYTLDYPTNGEAGDWLTGAKSILNMDLEVGDPDQQSEQFYPPRMILDKIVNYDWIAMRHFLAMHVISFELEEISLVKDRPVIILSIANKSISTLRNFTGLVSVNFKPGSIVAGYTMEYGHKPLANSDVELIPMIENKLDGPIKGKHIMDIKISFKAMEDLSALESVGLEIVREQTEYMGYPHQKYTFKVNGQVPLKN